MSLSFVSHYQSKKLKQSRQSASLSVQMTMNMKKHET